MIYFKPKVYLETFGVNVYADNRYVYEVHPYATPASNNINLKLSNNKICANTEFDFDKGYITLTKRNSSDVFNPNIQYSIEPKADRIETIDESKNELAKWHISDKLNKNTEYIVTINDNDCSSSNIDLSATISVEEVSSHPENEISIKGCSYEYENEAIKIQVKDGETIKFTKDKNNYNYNLYVDETPKALPTSIVANSDLASKKLYLQKYSISTLGCEGEQIPVVIEVVKEIENNTINFPLNSPVDSDQTTYYICAGAGNPEIKGNTNINGGYGKQTIIWRIKYEGSSIYTQIKGSENELYSLSSNIFNITQNCEIQRVIKMADGTFESASNTLKFKVYDKPEFKLTLDKEEASSKANICYESSPIFSIDHSSNDIKTYINNIGQTKYNIVTKKTENGIEKKIDTTITVKGKFQNWVFDHDATISVSQEFCGTYYDWDNNITLTIKDDLSFSEKNFSYSCPILGKELEITPNIDDKSEYSYKVNNQPFISTNIVKLPVNYNGTDNSGKYVEASVTRTLDGCSKTEIIKIKNVLEPLQNRKLTIESSLSPDHFEVCLNTDYTVSDNNNAEDNVSYIWSTKNPGASVKDNSSKDAVVNLKYANDIYRKRTLGDNCEVKIDTIEISVLDKTTTLPKINVTEKELCYGEELTISAEAIPGYTISNWVKTIDDKKSNLGYRSEITEAVKSSGEVEYEVTMESEQCPDYVISNSVIVNVAPKLTIETEDITISPVDINKSLFNEDNQSVNVTLTDTKNIGKEQQNVWFNFNDPTNTFEKKNISGGKWTKTYSIEESDLDEGLLSGKIFRTYSFSKSGKTCVSDTFSIYITPNNGFEPIAINPASDNLTAGGIYYFCNKGKLQLSNTAIVYGDKELDKESYTLQWYKKSGTSGIWILLKGEISEEIEISTEKLKSVSESYKLVVSYSAGGKTYKQSSNVIEVRNVSKPAVNIALANGDLSFCYAGNSDITLQTNTLSTPEGATETNNSYIWQKSNDGETWSEIKQTLIPGELVISLEEKNDVSTMNHHQYSMTEPVYFRVQMTDICQATAISNTIATSTYKDAILTSKDAIVMSNSLIQDKDNFDVVFFVNHHKEGNEYNYYDEEGELIATTEEALYRFTKTKGVPSNTSFDYSLGKHSVYIEKVISSGCHSDKVKVDYELIGELNITVSSQITDNCPGHERQDGRIWLRYDGGGIPENGMSAEWYYRFEDEEFFKKVEDSPLEYQLKADDYEEIENGTIFGIHNLDRTCYFYAEIYNEGYPAKYVRTNPTVKFEILPTFKIKSASSDKSQYCYKDEVVLSAGEISSSAGKVTYEWIDLNNEDKIYPNTEDLVIDAITKSTTFKRIAKDECGSTNEDEIKISVREKLEMSADEYEHAKYSEMGKVPYISVKNLQSVKSYMVSHINQEGIKDKKESKSSGATDLSFEMPSVEYALEKYEIYKTDGYGCISVPDTFTIKGIDEISAGKIAFEKYDSKSINVCHGEKIGRIIDEKVANGGSDITYKWFYIEKGQRWMVMDNNGLDVVTSVFDTDSIGINIASNKEIGNKIKTYALFRQATMNVPQADGTLTPYIKYSDTLYINVAPQLANCNIENLAGKISTRESAFCGGAERSDNINLKIEEDIEERYIAKNFGALLFNDDHELTGYWETSRGNKNNFEQVTDAQLYEEGFKNTFFFNDLDTTSYVRFTISDGCSSESTTPLAISVISFEDDDLENYNIVSKELYIELGDNITVTDQEAAREWYSNKNENSLIGENYQITLDSVTYNTRLYHKRIKTVKNTTCTEPTYFEIPLDIHPVSNGGRIASSHQVCQGEEFKDIKNYESAYGGTELFRYGWEITTDSSDVDSWKPINNAFADTLNFATLKNQKNALVSNKVNYIRRTARPIYKDKVVTIEAYIRYSNVIALETYKPLKASSIEWSEPAKDSYCAYERIPNLKVNSPTGGSAEYRQSEYKIDWLYSVDNQNWNTYLNSQIRFGSTSEISADFLADEYFEENDRTKDVTFLVKAVFTDKECGEIETDIFRFKVWAEVQDPELYIGADSCDSKYISFMVENDKDYYYNWTIGTDSINPVKTDFKEQYKMDFERHPAYIVEDGYSVQGMHKISGCKTSVTYFNVDSLPVLQQAELPLQDKILCYGADLDVTHSIATGGTGTKSYLWQYSYDNEKWNDANADKDFFYEDVRSDIYIRRMAYTDICKDTIISKSVLYKVADKINPLSVDIEENLCKNQDMMVNLSDSLTNNYNVVVYQIAKDTIKVTELSKDKLTGKIKGNELDKNVFGVVTYDSTYSCKSVMIEIEREARPNLSNFESLIESDEDVVCEGSAITIKSSTDYALPKYLKQRFESSEDGITWTSIKEYNSYKEDEKVIISDTTYFRTVLFNGCKDSIISNRIKIYGKETTPNPMWFTCLTSSNGEITLKGFDNNYNVPLMLQINDSTEMSFKEQAILDKETEKIVVTTLLNETNRTNCYSPVEITPLKKGNIFTECKSTGKQIVAEDVENAGEDIRYEWFKYGNDNTMRYFTEVTSKNYPLTPDDEQSLMVRDAYSNIGSVYYTLRSNILQVNANGSSISKLSPLEKDSLIANGLKVGDHAMQLNIGMDATLSCFIDDATSGEWQSSEDGETWKTVEKFDSVRLDSVIYAISPESSIYYRVVASNSCGTTTSDSIKVTVASIPEITEDCIIVESDFCEKTATLYCYDDEQKNLTYKYGYDFEIKGKYEKSFSTGNKVSISGINGELEITIIRSYNGVSVKYIKRIDMSKTVSADFSLIAEEVEYASDNTTSEWAESVKITKSTTVPSGTKIALKNRSENAVSYKWEVYYDGIKMATSYIDNPLLYVYNEGSYSFHLTAYSGKCESSYSWDGIKVEEGTLRTFRDYSDEDTDFEYSPEFRNMPIHNNSVIEVYPTIFDNELYIKAEGTYSFALYTASGVVLLRGKGNELSTISTTHLREGQYTMRVNELSFKLIKE
ncbi:MAG: hypothetical protein MJZ19_05340 [Paludibacteraceae bacterium]|nr:hypothetical protein [Paludibacteraceae bacterium]